MLVLIIDRIGVYVLRLEENVFNALVEGVMTFRLVRGVRPVEYACHLRRNAVCVSLAKVLLEDLPRDLEVVGSFTFTFIKVLDFFTFLFHSAEHSTVSFVDIVIQ